MRFHMSVDIDAMSGDPQAELSRILRYWAGNLKHYELAVGTSEQVFDSEYAQVGTWDIAA